MDIVQRGIAERKWILELGVIVSGRTCGQGSAVDEPVPTGQGSEGSHLTEKLFQIINNFYVYIVCIESDGIPSSVYFEVHQ